MGRRNVEPEFRAAMAKCHERSWKDQARAGNYPAQAELSALLPLVRLLAREAARQVWSASHAQDSTTYDDQSHDPNW